MQLHVHTPCPPNSLDAIVAPIQVIGDSTLFFHEITTAGVYETARMLSCKSKGQSPDGLPWKYLESLLLQLLPFSVKIINCSIITNNYPDLWKRAFIIPLNKCNNPQSVSDIRPIANLCHLAKIFYKIIANQISLHLERNSLLSPFQFGFRSEHNTSVLHRYDSLWYRKEPGHASNSVRFPKSV